MVIELLSRQDLDSRGRFSFPHHYTFGLLPIFLRYRRTLRTDATIKETNALRFDYRTTPTSYIFVHTIIISNFLLQKMSVAGFEPAQIWNPIYREPASCLPSNCKPSLLLFILLRLIPPHAQIVTHHQNLQIHTS